MYEKLDKLRAEVKRWEQRIEDDKAKLRIAQEKLEKASTLDNGYFAFVCDKCAPTFAYYGWFGEKNLLTERAKAIYERLGASEEG